MSQRRSWACDKTVLLALGPESEFELGDDGVDAILVWDSEGAFRAVQSSSATSTLSAWSVGKDAGSSGAHVRDDGSIPDSLGSLGMLYCHARPHPVYQSPYSPLLVSHDSLLLACRHVSPFVFLQSPRFRGLARQCVVGGGMDCKDSPILLLRGSIADAYLLCSGMRCALRLLPEGVDLHSMHLKSVRVYVKDADDVPRRFASAGSVVRRFTGSRVCVETGPHLQGTIGPNTDVRVVVDSAQVDARNMANAVKEVVGNCVRVLNPCMVLKWPVLRRFLSNPNAGNLQVNPLRHSLFLRESACNSMKLRDGMSVLLSPRHASGRVVCLDVVSVKDALFVMLCSEAHAPHHALVLPHVYAQAMPSAPDAQCPASAHFESCLCVLETLLDDVFLRRLPFVSRLRASATCHPIVSEARGRNLPKKLIDMDPLSTAGESKNLFDGLSSFLNQRFAECSRSFSLTMQFPVLHMDDVFEFRMDDWIVRLSFAVQNEHPTAHQNTRADDARIFQKIVSLVDSHCAGFWTSSNKQATTVHQLPQTLFRTDFSHVQLTVSHDVSPSRMPLSSAFFQDVGRHFPVTDYCPSLGIRMGMKMKSSVLESLKTDHSRIVLHTSKSSSFVSQEILLQSLESFLLHERFCVLPLNLKNRLGSLHMLSLGGTHGPQMLATELKQLGSDLHDFMQLHARQNPCIVFSHGELLFCQANSLTPEDHGTSEVDSRAYVPILNQIGASFVQSRSRGPGCYLTNRHHDIQDAFFKLIVLPCAKARVPLVVVCESEFASHFQSVCPHQVCASKWIAGDDDVQLFVSRLVASFPYAYSMFSETPVQVADVPHVSQILTSRLVDAGPETENPFGLLMHWLEDSVPLPKAQFLGAVVDGDSVLQKMPHTEDGDVKKSSRIPSVKWEDVGGLKNVRTEVAELLDMARHPGIVRRRTGLLMYGPPGTGKTLVAKAIATECAMSFLSVKGPELLDMYIGESERRLRAIMDEAAQIAPCVVFFDELDAIVPSRGVSGDSGGVMDRLVSQLVSMIDNLAEVSSSVNKPVLIVGATNRPDLVDPALLRPGRFERLVYVGVQRTASDKLLVLRAATNSMRLSPDVDLPSLACAMPDTFTGADIAGMCKTANMLAFRRLLSEFRTKQLSVDAMQIYVETSGVSTLFVEMKDFLRALESTKPSISALQLEQYDALSLKFSSPSNASVPPENAVEPVITFQTVDDESQSDVHH
eukprot:ANDGO_07072.mRNA.1 Peroxisome biogenesis protein 6